MANTQSPSLPLQFKFETPNAEDDAKMYTRRELERIVEYMNDHILALKQEIEDVRQSIP